MKMEIETSLERIQSITELRPQIAVILGSGLGGFADLISEKKTATYKDIFPFWKSSVPGHSGKFHIGKFRGKPICCMEGRPHYYEGYSDEEMRVPVLLLQALGIKTLIVTNACGGMNPEYIPGDIMLISDHINMTGRNPLAGMISKEGTSVFCDMSEPYDTHLTKKAEKAASAQNIRTHTGIYVGYNGPSYETKAEINAYRRLGGDVVGMSTVPEVIIAKWAGMKILGISCITNKATGLGEKKLSHQEVLEVANKTNDKLTKILTETINQID